MNTAASLVGWAFLILAAVALAIYVIGILFALVLAIKARRSCITDRQIEEFNQVGFFFVVFSWFGAWVYAMYLEHK